MRGHSFVASVVAVGFAGLGAGKRTTRHPVGRASDIRQARLSTGHTPSARRRRSRPFELAKDRLERVEVRELVTLHLFKQDGSLLISRAARLLRKLLIHDFDGGRFATDGVTQILYFVTNETSLLRLFLQMLESLGISGPCKHLRDLRPASVSGMLRKELIFHVRECLFTKRSPQVVERLVMQMALRASHIKLAERRNRNQQR